MYEQLKRRAGILATVMALTAVILAALPGVAEAEEKRQEGTPDDLTSDSQPTPQAPTNYVVVAPGDSLWTIVQGYLGPDAPPPQVASEVERIFELNQHRIGDDPNLILVGQKLSLTPVTKPSGTTVAQREPGVVAEAGPAEEQPAAEGQPAAAGRDVAEQTPEDLKEPSEASPERQEEVSAAQERSLPVPDNAQRRLLGIGVLALTLLLAIVMALRVPLRRDDYPRYGESYPGYGDNYAQPYQPEQQNEEHQIAEPEAAERVAPEPKAEPAPQGPAAATSSTRDIARRRRRQRAVLAARQRHPRRRRHTRRWY